MTKVELRFSNNHLACGKMTLLPKRTLSAIKLRAQKPRVLQAPPNCSKLTAQFGKSECGALIMESIWRAPQREKRMQSCAKSRRTFGCLSNHGKKFCLFQNFFREYHAAPLREECVNFFNNFIARGKMTLLPKRTQFAAYLRLLGKGVNARDLSQESNKRSRAEGKTAVP